MNLTCSWHKVITGPAVLDQRVGTAGGYGQGALRGLDRQSLWESLNKCHGLFEICLLPALSFHILFPLLPHIWASWLKSLPPPPGTDMKFEPHEPRHTPPPNHNKNQGHALLPSLGPWRATSSQLGHCSPLPGTSRSVGSTVFSYPAGAVWHSQPRPLTIIGWGPSPLPRVTQHQGYNLSLVLGLKLPWVCPASSREVELRKKQRGAEMVWNPQGQPGTPVCLSLLPTWVVLQLPVATEFHTPGPGLREAGGDTQPKVGLLRSCPVCKLSQQVNVLRC